MQFRDLHKQYELLKEDRQRRNDCRRRYIRRQNRSR